VRERTQPLQKPLPRLASDFSSISLPAESSKLRTVEPQTLDVKRARFRQWPQHAILAFGKMARQVIPFRMKDSLH
ncbi:MAG TPA: hypothetical protein PK867_13555, partial [Pirellulales bacterium]|nr:hypothetical protein [Pirellulales bacterium]